MEFKTEDGGRLSPPCLAQAGQAVVTGAPVGASHNLSPFGQDPLAAYRAPAGQRSPPSSALVSGNGAR